MARVVDPSEGWPQKGAKDAKNETSVRRFGGAGFG